MVAMLLLAVFSGCSESGALIDGITGDDSNIIHVGGIDRDVQTVTQAGYTTRANGNSEPAAGDKVPVDAETVNWLLGPLFGGLDITYGLKGKEAETQKVAILKLQKNNPNSDDISTANIKYSDYTGPDGERIAAYSFKYRTGTDAEGDDAIWYDNGVHYFQGVFVPEKLRYLPPSQSQETVYDPTTGKAPNLKLDQSKEGNEDNYTLLSRYLGMPADATIHATVGRVKLPFRHRLARVLAYVLIDPTMGNDVTIKGYQKDANGKDDAASSEIKFCNVKVLAGVEENDDATGHATLTPRWDTSRKVVPHFVEESGSKNSSGVIVDANNFIMFYDSDNKEFIFPTDDAQSVTTQVSWEKANSDWNSAYSAALADYTDDPRRESKAAEAADKSTKLKRTKYGKVPVYDLIVRPTYKSEDMVMYDEDLTGTSKEALVTMKNNIDFEITLSNGLEYTKQFEFDLDANYQTIVYLRISRESIDYNSSGADKWKEETSSDDYYGVNNQNGNTLSFAGSSWQRAYRLSGHFSQTDNVTDGHWYTKEDGTDNGIDDAMPNYQQYVSQTKWLEMFAEAHEGGLHHGDYFILDENITIDAKALPADFVFTGHLDGQDHTITLTGMGEKVVDMAAWDEDNYEEATPADYTSTLYLKVGEVYSTYVKPTLYVYHAAIPATYYETVDEYNEGHKDDAGFTSIDETTFSNLPRDQKIKTPAQEAKYVEASPQPSVAEMMSGTYYERIGDEYSVHHPVLFANHPIHHGEVSHTSGSTLFAGLNGAYTAAIGVANVHSEGGKLVPYVDNETHTGWRAEVINTKISGADMFPASVFNQDGSYDVSQVSGYIYNCWKVDGVSKTLIKPHTPALPKYK